MVRQLYQCRRLRKSSPGTTAVPAGFERLNPSKSEFAYYKILYHIFLYRKKSLIIFNVLFRYRDYRNPPFSENKYAYSEEYWHLLSVRFAFVLVFENVILMTTTLTRWLIPDIPKKLMERIRHENFITSEIMIAQELRRAKGLTSSLEDKSTGDSMRSPNPAYDNPLIKEELI
ncbi:anoctamin-1-like [Stegodyphus dumicola]|uniref:anoctamin-1-like n=1 Tax=Stegodyphus dumicola TaxID=202533 RepID=UPI0015AB498A|nr:anoctamin-1-like [Stegodyphus dumicola]